MINDLILVENLAELKKYRIILCGENPLAQKLCNWLDGSELEITVAPDKSYFDEWSADNNTWLFVPNDEQSEWNEITNEKSKTSEEIQIRISTLGALHYAVTLSGGVLFTEENQHLLEEKIYDEKMDSYDRDMGYMTFVVLSDADVDEMKEKNPVLAHGTAKVGTTSIFDSLLAAGINSRHLHAIIGDEIIKTIKSMPERVKIISGVREPLSRDLSLFFQSESSYNRYVASQGDFEERLQNMMKNLYKNSKFLFGEKPSPYGLEFGWFDQEFKEKFGLDIYETPFDKEKGYTIYHKDNIDVFLYRLEDLNGLESELQDFLGCPEFKLLHTNNAAEKNIANIYKELKKKYVFPKAQAQLYYLENERMDYFYTKEEQEAFLRKLNVEL